MQDWRKQPAGERFVYAHAHHKSLNWPRRIVYLFASFLLVIVGILAIPLPGPGWAILFFALGLLSRENIHLARFLDRVDLHFITPLAGFSRRHRKFVTAAFVIFIASLIISGWLFGPQWSIGPLHWGNLHKTLQQVKQM